MTAIDDRPAVDVITEAYAAIMATIPYDADDGTIDTPRRAAKALLELTGGYTVDVDKLTTVFAANGYDEMVVAKGTPFASLCEHHLLPFVGEAHVAYLPDGKVIGLSKMPRIVQAYARRLQIQERLTVQIADAIVKAVDPRGVMVVITAEHACCTQRGVRSAGTTMVTSVTRGAFRDNPETRAEGMSLFGL